MELFYLAVIILRSRPKKQEEQLAVRTPSSGLQSFCAANIVSIASEEFKTSITFWAGVPYAVSLAASVAYQSLRNCSIPYKRKRAYAAFQSSCDTLDDLGKSFMSARTMARLATDTLQEVERVAVGRNVMVRGAGRVSGRDGMPTTGPATVQPGERSVTPATANGVSHAGSHPHPTTVDRTPLLSRTAAAATNGTSQYAPGPDTAATAATATSPFFFDVSFLDNFTGEAGIFNDFDPNFDLGRIDALFSANLDPTLPLLPGEWMEGRQHPLD